MGIFQGIFLGWRGWEWEHWLWRVPHNDVGQGESIYICGYIYMDIYVDIIYGYMWIYMDNFMKKNCRGMGELCKVYFTCLKIVLLHLAGERKWGEWGHQGGV